MQNRLVRIVAVILVMLMFAGANPFRIIPDEMIYVGDTMHASAAQRQDFVASADPDHPGIEIPEGAWDHADPEENPKRARVVQVIPESTEKTASADASPDAPADDNAPADSPASDSDRTDAPASVEPGQEQLASGEEARRARTVSLNDLEAEDMRAGEATEPAATPEPTPEIPVTPEPLQEKSATEGEADEVAEEIAALKVPVRADAEDVVWEPTPTPTPREVSSSRASAAEKPPEDASKDMTPKATAHPVLGTVQKTWQVKENGLNIRVDRRKIGSNVAFVATIRAEASRMHTYTVAGPGKTAGFKYTSTLAKGVDAAIAINGDCYDYKTRRGYGIVVRNGVVYNNRAYGRWSYIVYDNGNAKIIQDYNVDLDAELMKGAKDIYAFGPALVRDGKFVKPSAENTHPRTAIGRVDNNTWIMIVVDGRQSGYSVGMTYRQLADLFIALGCDTAYNLDGGGSSAIWLKGYGVLNKPSDGGERSTPDIIYFR